MSTDPETPGQAAPDREAGEGAPLPARAPADPSGFRLRGDPPRVMRLSRKVIAGLSVVGALAVGGALTYALQSRNDTAPAELYNTDNRAVTERVTSAPSDYGQAPRLGPPLPGDLGGPILSAQERGQNVPVPPIGTQPGQATGDAPTPAEQAAQRAAQEREAAIASRLFSAGQGGSAAPAALASPTLPGIDLAALGAAAAPAAPPPPDGPNLQRGKREFTERGAESRTVNAGRLTDPVSPFVVQAGNVIAAALITGISSDLPGQVTAQVTQAVYDSPTGRTLLIPQGSRLIGDYDSQVAHGQRRVLLVWNRLILPDGRSIVLDRQPAGDAAGYAGLEDRVDQH